MIADALGESFEVAVGNDSSIKFRIENDQENYQVICPAEISYVAVERDIAGEEEKKGGGDDMDELDCEVLVTVQ